jgi:hypothetical protein
LIPYLLKCAIFYYPKKRGICHAIILWKKHFQNRDELRAGESFGGELERKLHPKLSLLITVLEMLPSVDTGIDV